MWAVSFFTFVLWPREEEGNDGVSAVGFLEVDEEKVAVLEELILSPVLLILSFSLVAGPSLLSTMPVVFSNIYNNKIDNKVLQLAKQEIKVDKLQDKQSQ